MLFSYFQKKISKDYATGTTVGIHTRSLRRGRGTCIGVGRCRAACVLSQYERDLLTMRDQGRLSIGIGGKCGHKAGYNKGSRAAKGAGGTGRRGGLHLLWVGEAGRLTAARGKVLLREERRADHEHTHRPGRGVG